MLELVTNDPHDTDDDPSRSHNPVEQVVDIFVFAPLGLALEARSLWPKLARRGRRAIAGSRGWAGEQLDRVHGHTSAALDGMGLGAGGNGTAPTSTRSAPPARPRQPVASRPRAAESTTIDENIPVIDVASLGITDYDSLSASQVVPRLAGLDAGELEQVRLYEAGNRGRKTILSRIAQLQAG